MAAVLPSTQILPQSAHFLAPRPFNNQRHFGPRKQQQQQQPQHQHQQHQSGFGAFAPHHHSDTRSPASTSTSWRTNASATPAKASVNARRASPVRPRSDERSLSPRSVPLTVPSSPIRETKPTTSKAPFVYSPAELLRLAQSPLVGVSSEKRAVLEDFVERHVWRRGPATPSRSRSPRKSADGSSSSSGGRHSRRASSLSSSGGSSSHTHSDSE